MSVLWLSAALAAIAFALSTTVRGETDRASTLADGVRAYYVARGAVDRAALELLWGERHPDKRTIPKGATAAEFDFPNGVARVEIIPENSRLNVNVATQEELFRLVSALGLGPGPAREVAQAIDSWRRPTDASAELDRYYSSIDPSFRAPRASFQETEELLLVKGVTPELYYGTYIPTPEGSSRPDGARLVPREGLADCLSVYSAHTTVDPNTAQPAVLAAIGLSPYAVNALVERRRRKPLDAEELSPFLASIGAPANRLRVEIHSILTLRATARPRLANGNLSDLKRTVAAQVKYMPEGFDSPLHILRWYDAAWSE